MEHCSLGEKCWEFSVDVGGTFCDVVARDPQGRLHTCKLLSHGRTRGRVGAGSDRSRIVDRECRVDPPRTWAGYRIAMSDERGRIFHESTVEQFDRDAKVFTLRAPASEDVHVGTTYELFLDEPAPVTAMRWLTGVGVGEPLPNCSLRLGTTLGTNALLARKGARVALVTTRGFGDVLVIGDQSRPKLFELAVVKPEPLCAVSVEVSERIDASGEVIEALEAADCEATLGRVKGMGIDSLAVCLVNAYRNADHERMVAEMAERAGFEYVVTSTSLSPAQGFLARAETCVADANLAPVFREYLSSIGRALGDSPLRIMTGSGGLVAPESFSGTASVLSGPAGGLVAAAEVGRRAGCARVISFDMGGTSTDVSRYDGAFEYEYETRKAGVRIRTPVLGIETVAAGGGSVCAFDGYRFTVGPESAGADPGPACYGRGGPLTLTDVNLHLDRVPEDRFPFALDRAAVGERLAALAERVETATGRRMGDDEICEGFIDIANANMVSAIGRITTERGIDAGDFALVCFGGAGGQHACAVARRLGIGRIVVPALAGVLSAAGIAMADVKRFVERAIHRVFESESLDALGSVYASLEGEARLQVEAEGIARDCVECRRLMDVRYVGEGAFLTVEFKGGVAAFEAAHRRRYGYTPDDRGIEVGSIRVEAIGKTEPFSIGRSDGGAVTPSFRQAAVGFGGERVAARVYDASTLRAGFAMEGPAILAGAYDTVVVEPDWRGVIDDDGTVVLTDGGGEVGKGEKVDETDPVRLALFHRHFADVAERMGAMLRRTAVSTNVKERLDYSCAVFDAAGELVANAAHIPVHVGSMHACVKAVIESVADIRPGDVMVTNDPFRGGTHLPDVTVVTPVFCNGRRVFFTASRAHHAEIGGLHPGSMPADSTNLEEEGVLIRPFKLVECGRSRFDAFRALLAGARYPSRSPEENVADLSAQVAANQAGVDALGALIGRVGLGAVEGFARHIRRAAEGKMRDALRRMPDGVYRRTESLDDGTPISVSIAIDGEGAVVDFSGTGAVLPGNLNATPAIVSSAVLYCFRCLIDEDVPLNGGVLAPIRMVIPPSLLSPPVGDGPAPCAAVAGGNVETSQRLVDCMLGALGVAAASQGTMNNLSFGNARRSYYETICGGAGATRDADGADAVQTHMTNTRMTDVEVLEGRYPVRVVRFAIRRGSGGAGLRRGGDGCVRELVFSEPIEVSLVTQRRTTRPFGLEGGSAGSAGVNSVVWSDGTVCALGSCAFVAVGAGDRLTIETPGGGGFGALIGG